MGVHPVISCYVERAASYSQCKINLHFTLQVPTCKALYLSTSIHCHMPSLILTLKMDGGEVDHHYIYILIMLDMIPDGLKYQV